MLLKRCLELGARLAEPGEFTRRAFLNDKLDLAQAEAVADLIGASTESAARSALRSLQGEFSGHVRALQATLTDLRVLVEAMLDFPEEDLDFLQRDHVALEIKKLVAALATTLITARQGSLLRDGLRVALIGAPNVGKSSIINVLSKDDVAIVSAIPGTTRDLVRQSVDIRGLPVHIVDTAGLRSAEDPVEALGVARTRDAIAQADLVLLVSDLSVAAPEQLEEIRASLPANLRYICVHNKMDLVARQPARRMDAGIVHVWISAKTGAGVDLLEDAIAEAAGWQGEREDTFVARERHIRALEDCRERLESALTLCRKPSLLPKSYGWRSRRCHCSPARSLPTTCSARSSRASASVSSRMQHFAAEEIADLLDYSSLATAIGEALADTSVTAPERIQLATTESSSGKTLLIMPAWRQGGVLIVKVVTVVAENSERGLPSVQGHLRVFDARTGAVVATMDATELTRWRTAAASLLAARFLARPASRSLLVVGAGAIARHLIRAVLHRVSTATGLDLESNACARGATREPVEVPQGVCVRATESLSDTVGNADIISCATLSERALVLGEAVKSGTHVDLVGAFTPHMRESDDALIRRAHIFVDTRPGALHEAGDLIQPLAAGVFRESDIRGELADLVTSRSLGRDSEETITLFKSVGHAIEDLAACELVLSARTIAVRMFHVKHAPAR